jgi:Putative peptidoglycan binding domain
MRQAQRWLAGLSGVTALGVSLLGLNGVAGAQGTAVAQPSAPARAYTAAVTYGALADSAYQTAANWKPIHHTLKPGMKGKNVRKLQVRLNSLGYWSGKPDGQYGPNTIEAIWAFKEVQGIQLTVNPDNAGPATERALADPKAPRPVSRHHQRNRIDVRLRVHNYGGYLVLWRQGKVKLISHISPGGGYYYCDPPPNQTSCGYATTPTGN